MRATVGLAMVLLLGCSSSTRLPDGEWSFSLQGSRYAAGKLKILAPDATLTLVLTKEGTAERAGCVLSTARVEVVLGVSGGMGNGSVTYVSQKVGAACSAAETRLSETLLSTFQVRRSAGSGTGFDNPDGTWEVTGSRPDDVAQLSLNGGVFSGTFMNRPGYSFSGTMMQGVANAADTWGAMLDGTKN